MRGVLSRVAVIVVFIGSLGGRLAWAGQGQAGQELASQSAAGQGPVIVTNGVGIVRRAPDRALVTIAVDGRAPKSADAQRLANDALRAIQAAVTATGIPAAAMRTLAYSVRPNLEYSRGASTVKGYIASSAIEVRIDDLTRTGDVVDAAQVSPLATISNVRFELKDRETIEREALQQAVQDARSRAEAMATGAGSRIGAIVRIENQLDRPMYATAAADASGLGELKIRFVGPDGEALSPGEIEIRASVTLTVSIR